MAELDRWLGKFVEPKPYHIKRAEPNSHLMDMGIVQRARDEIVALRNMLTGMTREANKSCDVIAMQMDQIEKQSERCAWLGKQVEEIINAYH